MGSPEARMVWLLDFIESWIVRAEAEKHAMPECSERVRLDGELKALRVLRNMIVCGEQV